jgi:hypothetical protein
VYSTVERGCQIYCADPSPLLSQNVVGASASASGWSYSAVGSVVVERGRRERERASGRSSVYFRSHQLVLTHAYGIA